MLHIFKPVFVCSKVPDNCTHVCAISVCHDFNKLEPASAFNPLPNNLHILPPFLDESYWKQCEKAVNVGMEHFHLCWHKFCHLGDLSFCLWVLSIWISLNLSCDWELNKFEKTETSSESMNHCFRNHCKINTNNLSTCSFAYTVDQFIWRMLKIKVWLHVLVLSSRYEMQLPYYMANNAQRALCKAM